MLLLVRNTKDFGLEDTDLLQVDGKVCILDTDDFTIEAIPLNDLVGLPFEIVGVNDGDGLCVPRFDDVIGKRDLMVGIGDFFRVTSLYSFWEGKVKLLRHGNFYNGFEFYADKDKLFKVNLGERFLFTEYQFESLSFQVKDDRGVYHTRFAIHDKRTGKWVYWFYDMIFDIGDGQVTYRGRKLYNNTIYLKDSFGRIEEIDSTTWLANA